MAIEDELEPVRRYTGKDFAAVAETCRKYEIPVWSLRSAIESLGQQPDLNVRLLTTHVPMDNELKGGRLQVHLDYVGDATFPTEDKKRMPQAASDYLNELGARTGLELSLEGANGGCIGGINGGRIIHPSSGCDPGQMRIVAGYDAGGDGTRNQNLRLIIEKL